MVLELSDWEQQRLDSTLCGDCRRGITSGMDVRRSGFFPPYHRVN
jgi:hypothetical protein